MFGGLGTARTAAEPQRRAFREFFVVSLVAFIIHAFCVNYIIPDDLKTHRETAGNQILTGSTGTTLALNMAQNALVFRCGVSGRVPLPG